MAIKTIITCDVRGEQKQETNHWFVIFPNDQFVARRWGSVLPGAAQEGKHACSRSCAQKLFEGWMEKAA